MSETPVWLWATTVAALCLLWLVVAWRQGPQRAIGCVVIVASLIPTWAKLVVAEGVWLDCRVIATVFGLVAYCFHPKATFPWKLGWLDASMIDHGEPFGFETWYSELGIVGVVRDCLNLEQLAYLGNVGTHLRVVDN